MSGANIVAVVLAAGQGARFGVGQNKLLVELDGRAPLRRAVDAARASRVSRTIVVTGHARAKVEAALSGLPLDLVHNPDFACGLASSLRLGLSAAAQADGALVLLADMPGVSPQILDALVEAFEAAPADCAAVVPVCGGKRGNPVLLARRLFPSLAELEGDAGARRLLQSVDGVVEARIDDEAIFADVDTRDDFDRLRGRLR
jgi:molybdenum cofactor cytidylyltransferase